MAERSHTELGPELSPEARDLLGAFRVDQSPAASVRARHWKGLERRLSQGPASAPAQAAGQGLYYAKVVGATVALAAGVLLAVKVVGLGVAAISRAGGEPAMEAPYQGAAESEGGQARERGAAAESARRGGASRAGVAEAEPAGEVEPSPDEEEPAPEAPAEADTEAEPSRSQPRPRARASRSSGSTTAASAASDLTAELALIKEATRAKQAGRTALGLEVLRRHAERFPSGTLADERRVLRAELLCVAGRVDEARAEAQAFLRQRSGSALSGRMRRACPEGE